MRIEEILKEPHDSLLYMERMVNDGSPSNFSFKYMTSKATCPLFVSQYNICLVRDSIDRFMSFGDLSSDSFSVCNNDFIYIHPDWQNRISKWNIMETDRLVYPTSSSRTVEMNEAGCYIKMAYPGVLGRITRELKLEHIASSIDITSILMDLNSQETTPSFFAFLPERGGRVWKSKFGEIGYVVRDVKPIGKNVDRIQSIIPAFSLFSKDRGREDVPIIIQILSSMDNPKQYLLYELIYPILDIYFHCIFNGGVQPEMHAQNFLIGVDSNLHIASIILRDLESVDKDLTIIQKNHFNSYLSSYPFKCIFDGQYNYRIKHSFMYDHKLGEYFFDPLIKCIREYGFVNDGEIDAAIKSYIWRTRGNNLIGFFPDDGMWYKFDNVLIDRRTDKRPYISIPHPKYR